MGLGFRLAVLLVVLCCMFTQGYSLICSFYVCQTTKLGKLACTNAGPQTCPDINHACHFIRLGYRENDGATSFLELANCTLKTQCMKDVCKGQNSTGNLMACESSCCQQDFCNAHNSTAPQPTTETLIDGGVTCYTCESMTINGKLNKTTCDNPKKTKCNAKQDRCINVKMTLVNKVGKIIPEYRGCADERYCRDVCRNANETEGGKFTTCDKTCCHGDLCNIDHHEPSPGNLVTQHSSLLLVILVVAFLMLFC